MDTTLDIYYHGNPFRGIYIPTSRELLDSAFKKAKRVSPPGGIKTTSIKKAKSDVIETIRTFGNYLSDKLKDLVRKMPSVEKLHPFYLSTMEIWVSKDDYKRSLGKINGASLLIKRMTNDFIIKIKKLRKENDAIPNRVIINRISRIKKEAYGRISSIVKSLDRELELLKNVVKRMRKLPDYDPYLPMIVVAGAPNTGKSSLVRAVSNAKVEVASYPFTTKNITFGHIEFQKNGLTLGKAQIADTPGIFDRPITERNEIELLAINAIKTLPDVVLFMFDVSVEAVLSPHEQVNILKFVLSFFEEKPIIITLNKIDIEDPTNKQAILRAINELRDLHKSITGVLEISVHKKIGIQELLEKLKEKLF